MLSQQRFFNVFLMFTFDKEREHEQGRAESEGDTESQADTRLCALSTEPDIGLELINCEIIT